MQLKSNCSKESCSKETKMKSTRELEDLGQSIAMNTGLG